MSEHIGKPLDILRPILKLPKICDYGMSFVRDLYPATPVGVPTIVGDIRPNSE
jgi:hypothetical protein